MGQITATRNLVAIKVVRHAGQLRHVPLTAIVGATILVSCHAALSSLCNIDDLSVPEHLMSYSNSNLNLKMSYFLLDWTTHKIESNIMKRNSIFSIT